MFAHRPSLGSLRRLAAILAAAICGLLASAAVIPAAFAKTDPGGFGGITRTAAGPPATVRMITEGGIAGWQITLIAASAAVVAGVAAVVVDRALAARRAASTPVL
jgi:hypothetical protein